MNHKNPKIGCIERWTGHEWEHLASLCCPPEKPKPENPNEWTHKCSYLAERGHADGKVTLTERHLDCSLCGKLSPLRFIRDESAAGNP